MKLVTKTELAQIVARKCKGFAFSSYPNIYGDNSPEDYYERVTTEVNNDAAKLSAKEFVSKYSTYIY